MLVSWIILSIYQNTECMTAWSNIHVYFIVHVTKVQMSDWPKKMAMPWCVCSVHTTVFHTFLFHFLTAKLAEHIKQIHDHSMHFLIWCTCLFHHLSDWNVDQRLTEENGHAVMCMQFLRFSQSGNEIVYFIVRLSEWWSIETACT